MMMPTYPTGIPGYPRQPYRAFNKFLYEFFFNFGKFVKIRDCFAEVTNSRSMLLGVGELGPHLTQCGRAEAYPHTKFHLDPSNRLATIHHRHRQDIRGVTIMRYINLHFTYLQDNDPIA